MHVVVYACCDAQSSAAAWAVRLCTGDCTGDCTGTDSTYYHGQSSTFAPAARTPWTIANFATKPSLGYPAAWHLMPCQADGHRPPSLKHITQTPAATHPAHHRPPPQRRTRHDPHSPRHGAHRHPSAQVVVAVVLEAASTCQGGGAGARGAGAAASAGCAGLRPVALLAVQCVAGGDAWGLQRSSSQPDVSRRLLDALP